MYVPQVVEPPGFLYRSVYIVGRARYIPVKAATGRGTVPAGSVRRRAPYR